MFTGIESDSAARRHPRGSRAVLYLDGTCVGDVAVKGWTGSWGYGDFVPQPEFSQFAPLFGQWSLLMHAEDQAPRLSHDAVEELNRVEEVLDSLRVRLFFPESQAWVNVAQLTIENELLEWKEY